MAAVVRAGQTSVSILSYLVLQQNISSGSVWTFFKSPNNAKPYRCVQFERDMPYNYERMVRIITDAILPILFIFPLTIFCLENKTQLKTIGLFVVIFVLYQILLVIPIEYKEFNFLKGKWNWTGKIYGIIFGLTMYFSLIKQFKQHKFLRIKQDNETLNKTIQLSLFPIIFMVLFSISLTSKEFNSETLFFQLTLPGFDEEIMFRAVLLGLLLTCLKDKILIGNYNLGNPSVLIIGLLFGLCHGVQVTKKLNIEFEIIPFISASSFGYIWSWIAYKSKSILQPVISHNLSNFFLNLIRMIR